MALDFPSTPADNTLWPPGSAVPGIAYTAKSSQWRDILGRASPSNRFTNPAFQISQVNGMTNGTNVAGLVMADEYYLYYTSNVGIYQGQLVASPTPKGSLNRMRVTINTADPTLASGEWLTLSTGIEGNRMADAQFGTANAKPLVVRFGWRSPAGTYNFNIRNRAFTRSFIAPFTVSAGEANTDTEQIIIVPPCTDGVWDTDTNAWAFCYWLMANFNTITANNANQWVVGNYAGLVGLSNGWSTAGNVFEMFDVGLYVDPNCTGQPPEWEIPDITEVWRLCQRYYAKVYTLRGVVGTATLIARAGTPLPVPMRVVPSLSIRGTPRFWDGTADQAITAVTNNYSTTRSCDGDFTCSGGGFALYRTAGNYNTGNAADFIQANARM